MINEPLLNRFWQFYFSSHWFYCRLNPSQVLSGSICLRHQFSYSDFLTPKRPQFIFVCDINFREKSFEMKKKEMRFGNAQIFLQTFPFIIWYLIIISHLGSVRGWAVTPWPRCLQGSLSRVWTRAKTKHFARNSQFWPWILQFCIFNWLKCPQCKYSEDKWTWKQERVESLLYFKYALLVVEVETFCSLLQRHQPLVKISRRSGLSE